MKKFKHWFAAIWVMTFVCTLITLFVGAVGYCVYWLVRDHVVPVLVVSGAIALVVINHWAMTYIEDNGYPWGRK